MTRIKQPDLKAPFPWFGGKSRVAHIVWQRFGDVPNYVEPFFGSGAVLLGRPTSPGVETVNDVDCYVSNFWRSIARDPGEVARHADWPVNEADLHARHRWLVDRVAFRERMKSDPDFCDAKIAGWWVWGLSQWIGSGWCQNPDWRGRYDVSKPKGLWRKRPLMKRSGVGVHRNIGEKRPLLIKSGAGVHRRLKQQLPDLGGDSGAAGRGVHASGRRVALEEYFARLAERLRRTRVCCGDWSRILGPSPTVHIGVTGVFLDPPYGADADRYEDLYSSDDLAVAGKVREWAIAHGDTPKLRIALCGYEGEHEMPDTWTCVAWQSNGGYAIRANGRGKLNASRERIWFSPHCLQPVADLFEHYENRR